MADGSVAVTHRSPRFSAARREAAERATLQVAFCQLEIAGQTLARGKALLEAAITAGPDERAKVRRMVAAALQEAIADVDEVAREIVIS